MWPDHVMWPVHRCHVARPIVMPCIQACGLGQYLQVPQDRFHCSDLKPELLSHLIWSLKPQADRSIMKVRHTMSNFSLQMKEKQTKIIPVVSTWVGGVMWPGRNKNKQKSSYSLVPVFHQFWSLKSISIWSTLSPLSGDKGDKVIKTDPGSDLGFGC